MRGRPRSVDRGTGRPGIQPRKKRAPGRRRRGGRRKATSGASPSQDALESRAVRDPAHARTHLAREPGEPVVTRRGWRGGSHWEVQGRTPMMHDPGQSDSPAVPTKFPNKAGEPAAEGMEGRGLAKGNPRQQTAPRAQDRVGALSALERVRQVAERDKPVRFTTLLHHVYHVDHLRRAYYALKREAAPGMDGETWQHYGEALEENLRDLSGRLARGAYRAKPVQRAYIPKADGRQHRPLGIPTLEDKLVQRATVDVLNAIYETDFLGFSYGFRPGRSPHHALDALYAGLLTRKVNWVLDADIRGCYEAIDYGWLVKFVEHRIADRRVVRLIQKWLKAGVLEDGKRTWREEGTPQGASVSPLLANVYLHYVFDLWVRRWRRTQAHGDVIVVRFADDFIVGFQHRADAERFLAELRERFAKFGLELHPEKTRMLEFGPFAADDRRRAGRGKPETFDFLGLTHICGKKRNGRFTVVRQTIRKRLQAKLHEVKAELRRRLHDPISQVGTWLGQVVGGHTRYYGVPMNSPAIALFRFRVGGLWHRALARRSHTGHVSWERMRRLIERWLPPARICHPYPLRRLGVVT